jgi:hypothetical protein
MKIELVFESYENAPKTGESFIAVLPGPNIDIVWFDKEEILNYRLISEEIIYDINLDGILE